ncbi:MAG: tRNA pseudouridine(55) synthase TruB [Planctomycetes bacterium RBG_16_64_10]|nr:MAG: tRNA pseudouridine(55) synthase TruB [Planctomycetes bacterium RBG_16_64_10]
MPHFGLLNINKPAGVTSHRVVDQVRRVAGGAKVGHAGTLDPLAAGVLILGVGPATRLTEYVQRMRKCYRATFLLGQRSDSDDVESPITILANAPRPTLEELARAGQRLTGCVQQRPPAFSAIKVGGQRAYHLARRGELVDLAPRPVLIYGIRLIRYEHPQLDLEIECGAGTYVRCVGRDLAESVGTAAVMSALTRTAIGHFGLATACQATHLTPDNLADFLLPPRQAIASLPQIRLTDQEQVAVAQGRTIAQGRSVPDGDVAALDQRGRLVAILRRGRQGGLAPVKNFAAA